MTYMGGQMVAGEKADRWIATPEEIDAWFDKAAPGDEFVYARAVPALPTQSRTRLVALDLLEAGRVGLHLRRASGVLTYFMRRAKARMADPEQPVPGRLEGDDARLYRILSEWASRSLACPCNRMIGRAIGVSASTASYRLRRLAALGFIKVDGHANTLRPRIVTIVASGKRTGAAA